MGTIRYSELINRELLDDNGLRKKPFDSERLTADERKVVLQWVDQTYTKVILVNGETVPIRKLRENLYSWFPALIKPSTRIHNLKRLIYIGKRIRHRSINNLPVALDIVEVTCLREKNIVRVIITDTKGNILVDGFVKGADRFEKMYQIVYAFSEFISNNADVLICRGILSSTVIEQLTYVLSGDAKSLMRSNSRNNPSEIEGMLNRISKVNPRDLLEYHKGKIEPDLVKKDFEIMVLLGELDIALGKYHPNTVSEMRGGMRIDGDDDYHLSSLVGEIFNSRAHPLNIQSSFTRNFTSNFRGYRWFEPYYTGNLTRVLYVSYLKYISGELKLTVKPLQEELATIRLCTPDDFLDKQFLHIRKSADRYWIRAQYLLIGKIIKENISKK